jgi:hypothetical protein
MLFFRYSRLVAEAASRFPAARIAQPQNAKRITPGIGNRLITAAGYSPGQQLAMLPA